jgi:hypothetical protein
MLVYTCTLKHGVYTNTRASLLALHMPTKGSMGPYSGAGGGAIGEAPARIGSTPQGSLNIPRWVVLGSPHKSEIFGGTGFFLVDIFRGGELNMGDYKKKGVKILVGEKR